MRGFINHIISTWSKRIALRETKRKLYKRYGIARFYTAEQVRTASQLAGIEERYIPFAYACFLTSQSFRALEEDLGQQHDYHALRVGIEDIGNPPRSRDPHLSTGGFHGSDSDGGFGGADGGGGGGGGDGGG
jgi:hypothetical protein